MAAFMRLINAALGIWLMCSPSVLACGNPARDHDHIVGPLAATFAIISLSGVTKGIRWLNVVAGSWLVLAPWLLSYPETNSRVNSVVVGIALAALSLLRFNTTEHYGGGWRALFSRAAAPDEKETKKVTLS